MALTPNQKLLKWLSIGTILVCTGFLTLSKPARADMFGGDVVVLTQILAETIEELSTLSSIMGKASDTVSVLNDMNAGVKEVLRIAETAHVSLPAQVYAQANQIDAAASEAQRLYGPMSARAPEFSRTHYRSGVEALYLSQDAADYTTFLDQQGRMVKNSAVNANQAAATRLTAETLGVMLHSMSHSTRIEAKNLELNSSKRIEESAQESSRFDSFLNTHDRFESDFRDAGFSSLNSFGEEN